MLELYQFEECPYCVRVRKKMTDLGIDCILRNEPRDKSQRERLRKICGQVGVPTLVDSDTGKIIPDDDDEIIAYLEERYGK